MNQCVLRSRSLRSGAVALAALATVYPTYAANLLVNPGFESPTDLTSSESTNINGWTVSGTGRRAVFQNHTPGGRWGFWARTFEDNGGVTQNVAGIVAGSTYTFSSQLYFETNFNQTTATVLGQLTWLDNSNNQVGSPSSFQVPFNSNPPTNAWTPFSISPTAPAGATQVRVFLGWLNGGGSGPSLSAFIDDADLEGTGTPPTSTWITNGAGDWNNADNWANVQVPNGIGAEADFFGAITAPHTVTARAGGAWTGNGITSSTARQPPNHNTTLGVLSGAEYSSVGGTGTFSGQSYAAGDTLVKYTYYGDTDFNGKVNFDDYVRTDNGFNNHLTGWLNGDFDGNGQVNFDDYVLIDLAFNTQSGTLGSSGAA
jgi:hypothetical protein